MMRTEEAVSASIWLAKVGRLTSTEKIKSDTAIERIVRIVLRLLRVRFLKTNNAYFVILSPVRSGCGFGGMGWPSGSSSLLRANEYALVKTVNCVHEAFRARVVRNHHNCFVKLPIEFCQQVQDFFRRFCV